MLCHAIRCCVTRQVLVPCHNDMYCMLLTCVCVARVGRLNLSWNEPDTTDLMPRFHAAMEMAGKELVDQIMNAYKSWLPARQVG